MKHPTSQTLFKEGIALFLFPISLCLHILFVLYILCLNNNCLRKLLFDVYFFILTQHLKHVFIFKSLSMVGNHYWQHFYHFIPVINSLSCFMELGDNVLSFFLELMQFVYHAISFVDFNLVLFSWGFSRLIIRFNFDFNLLLH